MKVIFLHGLGQGPSSWNKTVAAMDGGVEAFCPDLFALAQGEAPDYAALYRGLSEICREQTGDGLHLCGLSLGAVLALQYGQEHPEQVKSLVLIGGRTRTPRTLMKIQRILFRLMGERSFQKMGLSKENTMALMCSMGKLDLRKGLGCIRCPTLVLCGEKDGANRKEAAAMASGIPGAGLTILPGASHEVNREAPEQLAEVLLQFYGIVGKRKISPNSACISRKPVV